MAPPRYFTRRSQLPATAHARFASGHGYWAGPSPEARPPAPAPAAKPKRKSQTVAQAANSQVNQQLAPVLAQQGSFNQVQNKAIQDFALALMGKLAPLSGQVGSDYDKAIGQQSALAGAASNALRSANPNQQDQQMLDAVNAPQEQRDQIQNQLANTFGGGAAVTLFNQGESPGTQLATDKAAQQAQASKLPGIAALKGQQDLSSALFQQRQTREATLAQRPALVQQATQNIQGNLNERRKLEQADRQQQFENIVARGIDPVTGQLTPKAQADLQRVQQGWARIDASTRNAQSAEAGRNARAAASQEGQDRRAAASLKLRQKAQAEKKTTKGISPATYAGLKKQAGKVAETAYWGIEPKQRYDSVDAKWIKVPGTGTPGLGYQKALRQLMNDYSLKLSDAQALLNNYYAPGERGRPAKSYQQRHGKKNG